MKILVAEDDQVSMRLMRRHLETWGHEITLQSPWSRPTRRSSRSTSEQGGEHPEAGKDQEGTFHRPRGLWLSVNTQRGQRQRQLGY